MEEFRFDCECVCECDCDVRGVGLVAVLVTIVYADFPPSTAESIYAWVDERCVAPYYPWKAMVAIAMRM